MQRKKDSPDEIIRKLRESEVMMNEGADGGGGLPKTGNHGADVLSLAQPVWRAQGERGKADERDAVRECETETGDRGLNSRELNLFGLILNCKVVKYIFCLSK